MNRPLPEKINACKGFDGEVRQIILKNLSAWNNLIKIINLFFQVAYSEHYEKKTHHN